MELFNSIAILISLSALFSCINYHYLKIPTTIGLIVISLVLSGLVMGMESVGIHFGVKQFIVHIDFNETLMVGMLSFLLFAGALHVDINDLLDNKIEIAIFATVGVIFSTLIVGAASKMIFITAGLNVPWLHCFLFGALISPTDPIAVLGIMHRYKAPKDLEVKISGESLFNDGIGVVVFLALLGGISGKHDITAANVLLLFAEEVIGGALLGIVLGWMSFQTLKRVDEYAVEILITLSVVTGGYALALLLHVSGPIAIVIAGLMIGNQGRRLAMSDITRRHLDTFWELVDEILNAVLFVLIGLEVLVISLQAKYVAFGLAAVIIVLAARWCCIGIPIKLLKPWRQFSPDTVKILTWGGLRGGISVALALSLPHAVFDRDMFLTMTYTVVVFSLIVQGLTIQYLIKGSAKQ